MKSDKKYKIDELFKILKIKPKNINLYYQALTHKTFSNENKNILSYEKLEFLGDSILQMLSSLFIYEKFNKEPEGKLSIIRANNVSSKSLAKIIKKHKINNFLICSNNVEELKDNDKICSDIFESLLAAIYLDLGEIEAKKYLNRFLFNKIKSTTTKEEILKDPKTRLQELLQPIYKNSVQYICNLENGIWNCKAVCGKNIYGKGNGKTKKEAEINAAQNALDKKR